MLAKPSDIAILDRTEVVLPTSTAMIEIRVERGDADRQVVDDTAVDA
jgi:hypothetical protein